MRKAAGLKRGSRKKQQQQQQDEHAPSRGPPSSSSSSLNETLSVPSSSSSGGSSSHQTGELPPQQHQQHQQQRRKPTNEEAVLTSKNYRLAKELSELRVRHRDETKNVTRLTMENMNLASRCREAISHVAMLKKELAMHQKRASEALAMQQRQQQQRSNHSSSSAAAATSSSGHHSAAVLSELSDLARPLGMTIPSSTNVAVEMDRMDRIMASHAPPPPPPMHPVGAVASTTTTTETTTRTGAVSVDNKETSQSSSRQEHLTKTRSTEEYGDDDDDVVVVVDDASPTSSTRSSHSSSSSPNEENDTPEEQTNGGGGYDNNRAASLFPHTASPKPKHHHHGRLNYNDDYPGDVSPHKASHESSLPSVQDEDDESSELSAQSSSAGLSTTTTTSHAREVANLKLSSIDAFEASFDTAFPSSFASSKGGGSEQQQQPSEIYNPFFSSPQRRSSLTTPAGANNGSLSKSPSNLRIEDGVNSTATSSNAVDSPDGRAGKRWGTSVRDRSPGLKTSPTSSKRTTSTAAAVEETSNNATTTTSSPKVPSSASGKQQQQQSATENGVGIVVPEAHSPDRDEESSPSRMPDPSSSPKIVSRASTTSYAEQYRTPPHFSQKTMQEAEKPAEEPKRPEKTVSASARARYEKALQPRGYHSRMKDPNSSLQVETSMDTSVEARNSPGTVLRRLQQRRAKVDRFQPTVDANSNPIPGIEARRSHRTLRHPSLPTDESESPFDEDKNGKKIERIKGMGRIITDQNGSYIKSVTATQNESENNYRRSQTSPAVKKLSPDSMNAEIRALDAMASGSSYTKPGGDSPTGSDLSHNSGSSSTSSSRYAALKQRRSVKQPVSYAEPPLNTKVRQGDVFFQREGDPVAVSPTGSSSPGEADGSSARASSRGGASSKTTRTGAASSEEVLKDLKAPATVRS